MIVLLAGAVVVLLTAGATHIHIVYPLRRNCQMLWFHTNNAAHGVGDITRMEHLVVSTRFGSISRQAGAFASARIGGSERAQASVGG
jgi:hypothetical protein